MSAEVEVLGLLGSQDESLHHLSFQKVTFGKKMKLEYTSFELEQLKDGMFLSMPMFHENLNAGKKLDHTNLVGLVQNISLATKLYPAFTPLIFVDRTSFVRYPDVYTWYMEFMVKVNPETMFILCRWETDMDRHKVLSEKWKVDIPASPDIFELIGTRQGDQGVSKRLHAQRVKADLALLPATQQCVCLYRNPCARVCAREAKAIEEWLLSHDRWHVMCDEGGEEVWSGKPSCQVLSVLPGVNCDDMKPSLDMSVERFTMHYTASVLKSNRRKGLYVQAPWVEVDEATVMFHPSPSREAYALLPCRNVYFEGLASYYPKGEIAVGEDVYACGEIMPGEGLSRGLIRLILQLTLERQQNPSKFEITVYDLAALAKTKKYDLHEMGSDLMMLTVSKFISKYHFDKRIFPQFWYGLDRLVVGHIVTVASNGEINLPWQERRHICQVLKKVSKRVKRSVEHCADADKPLPKSANSIVSALEKDGVFSGLNDTQKRQFIKQIPKVCKSVRRGLLAQQ